MQSRIRDGVKLHYYEEGQGNPPLLFVHGSGCDHTDFAPQIAHFRHRHRVVAVDLRGHGRSDTPSGGYTIPDFADDIAWLCAALPLERPVVIGHSMGGQIARHSRRYRGAQTLLAAVPAMTSDME